MKDRTVNGLNITITVENVLDAVPESREFDLSEEEKVNYVCEQMYNLFIKNHLIEGTLPGEVAQNFTKMVNNSTYTPATQIRAILTKNSMSVEELLIRLDAESAINMVEKYKADCKATIYENVSKVCKKLLEINKEASWTVKEVKNVIDFHLTNK